MLLVAVITRNVQAQTVRRVSNALGANAPYTTIQAAVAAAVDGDIILVEGSPNAYGGFSVTKRVTIQGPGYFLTENTGLQANLNSASIIGSLSFDAGSAGSTISGMRLIDRLAVNVSNITISNNYLLTYLDINTASSNIAIFGNYISAGISTGVSITNLLISNNFIGFNISLGASAVVLGVVTNNIIAGNGNIVRNSTIANNIFLYAGGPPLSDLFNSTLQNNLFVAASQPGVDASNILGVSSASLFVGLTGNTTDTQFRLKSGSPAIGAGLGGTDCGIYGGTTPYKISGIATGQPTIYSLTTPGTVPANGTLNVKVSAKVN